MPMPAIETPKADIEGFVYPRGYFPPPTRVLDASVLSQFEPFEHPYIVEGCDGSPCVDPKAPVAVRRLRNGRCPNLTSAIRYLEIGGLPDESMEATYSCEDALSTARDYSEAGFHKTAINMIRGLPEPFQRTAAALHALVQSFMALSRFEEALGEVRRLIEAGGVPTDYSRTLRRLDEVQILLILGRLDEAEVIMNERRVEFREMYQYYGFRAALALARGDEPLARSLVVKAGRVNPYHCYKILWNPLLKPLEEFIRRELLTDTGEPRIYEQNSEIHRICNRIQGALILGDRERANNLWEGLVLHRITDWTAASEAMLALAGLGDFETLHGASYVLAGKREPSIAATRAIAAAVMAGDGVDMDAVKRAVNELECSDLLKDSLMRATTVLAAGGSFSFPETIEMPLVEVADHNYTDKGRNVFVIYARGQHLWLCKMLEPRRRRTCSRETDLRSVFPVVDTSEFESSLDAEIWIEEKLAANEAHPNKHGMYGRQVFDVHFDGWTLLATLNPSVDSAPLLHDACNRAAEDPNFYFQNGPAESFGMRTNYAARLLRMLSLVRP